MRFAALALAALLGGCMGGVRIDGLGLPQETVELDATPFFPQEVNQCGPAALATALGASGVAVTPDELAPSLYLPGKKGSLQAEVIASARRHGRVPYPLAPDLADVLGTVADGTPVLLLQNLALSWYPIWHYAVLVGYDTAGNTVLMRSGTDRRRVMKMRPFERSWRLGGYWALAIVDPASPPRRARMLEWLQAASAFEELHQPAPAAAAYLAATQRWPDQALPWQLLGNARYAQHDLAGAEDALRHAQQLAPSAATLNNLASVQLERGCAKRARGTIDQAAALEASDSERAAIEQTRAQIGAHRGRDAAQCRE